MTKQYVFMSTTIKDAAEAQIVEQSKRIEFYTTEYSVELLASKMRNGDFFIPGYQREFTWESARKSRFIESLIMGLPIPFLFFWEDPESGILEIVDGSQRLRTIEEFVLGDFQLEELDALPLISGMRFSDLLESRQRKIKNRSIRGIVLNEKADIDARFELFDRINTGSKIANMAEVRRGALSGLFQDLIVELANDSLFIALAPVSQKARLEREHEELVSRFFAYGDGLDNYQDYVGKFLFDYTKRMNDQFLLFPSLVQDYRERFNQTMVFVSKYFPNGFRRKSSGTTTPRARFEAIAIGSFLALQQEPDLAVQTDSLANWLESDSFSEVTTSDGANAKKRLTRRIHYVRDQLLTG